MAELSDGPVLPTALAFVNVKLVKRKKVADSLVGRRLFLWTANHENQWTLAKQLRAHGVITDAVEKAKKALKPSAGI